MQPYIDSLSHLIHGPYPYMVGLAVLLLLIIWVTHCWRQNHRPIIPFKTEGGTVEIAPQTLRGIIQHTTHSVEGVEKANCRHYVRGKGLRVKVAIHLRASSKLKDVEARIKSQIRTTLFEQFGMENVDPINIRVVKLIGEPMEVRPVHRLVQHREPEPVFEERDVSPEDTPPKDDKHS